MTNIKVIIKDSGKAGKKIVILAGVHGNEVCGIKAFNELIPNIKIEKGKVTFIYSNLKAIKQNKRFIEKNLNRCFFEKQSSEIKESLEGKTAKEIMPYLRNADAMLDIHASFTPNSLPFIICDKKWIKSANIFDAKVVSYNWDPFEPGSTDYYMNLKNKPGFCFECGYLKEEETSERAKQAIKQFLIWTECIKGETKLRYKQKIIRITSIYKNYNNEFKKTKYFPDFEKLKEKTLIGKEGNKLIFGSKEDILLFVRNCKNLGDECFLTARAIKKKTLKTPKEMN